MEFVMVSKQVCSQAFAGTAATSWKVEAIQQILFYKKEDLEGLNICLEVLGT